MLNVKDLNFSYKKTPVLKDLSFKVALGENLARIEESASVKRTILK